MKLRLLDNSIRLRLKRSEIQEVLSTGLLSRSTRLMPDRELRYTLAIDETFTAVALDFGGEEIRFRVPSRVMREWATTSQVSIESSQRCGDVALRILIEKDFVCAHQDGCDGDSFTTDTLPVLPRVATLKRVPDLEPSERHVAV